MSKPLIDPSTLTDRQRAEIIIMFRQPPYENYACVCAHQYVLRLLFGEELFSND